MFINIIKINSLMTLPSEFLKKIPIFSSLPNDMIMNISQVGSIQFFKKDTVILLEEEFGSTLFFLIEGKVKVSRTSNDGREVILSLLTPPNFFGEMALLNGSTRSASVSALEDSELFIIRRDEFLDCLKKYPQVAVTLIQELTRRLRAANLQIKSLSLSNAEGKIGSVILQLAYDTGKLSKGKMVIQTLPVQRTLANMAGTSRETVSRVLHSFVKKGLINIEGSKLQIIEFDKFRELYK